MRNLLLVLLLFPFGLLAQDAALMLDLSTLGDCTVQIDGEDYLIDGASLILIRNIPEESEMTVTIVGNSRQNPMVFFKTMSFEAGYLHHYQILESDKGNRLRRQLVELKEIEGDLAPDLGKNYVVFHYGNPKIIDRFKSEAYSDSGIKMTRKQEKGPEKTTIENGKEVKVREEKEYVKKEEGSSTVVNEERKTTRRADRRETTIMKPRSEPCVALWTEVERDSAFADFNKEFEDAGRLYIAKKNAIDYCFSVADAREMLEKLDMESSRIELAKFVYPSLWDKDEFESLEDVFDTKSAFESVVLYIDIKYE